MRMDGVIVPDNNVLRIFYIVNKSKRGASFITRLLL